MTQLARTGGHGYTFLEWMGKPILYLKTINHVAPTAVAQPAVIQPMNHLRPLEIAGPRAIGHGVLTVQVTETWDKPIWTLLSTFANSTDLADIFEAQNVLKTPIHVQKIILNPGAAPLGSGFAGGNNTNAGVPGDNHRTETFHGCKIADLRNGETLDLTSIEVLKDFDIWYTHCSLNPSPTKGAQHHTASAQNSTEGSQQD